MEENEVKDAEITASEETKKVPQKNDYLAVIVLLAGLLVGSVFVDVVQLVAGQGFSKSALRSGDVFEVDGKTWVAYTEPAVRLMVLTDSTCDKCSPDEALLVLRQYLPTMVAEKVESSSDEGKKLIAITGTKTLPAFVFEEGLEKTEFYTQAQPVLEKKEKVFVLNTQAMGVPVGKYLALPEVGEDSIVLGNKDAKVRVIEYCNFEDPYCKIMYPSIERALKEYGDKIAVVFKQILPSAPSQAENSALAVRCAHEQGKYKEYSDKLFAGQDQWVKSQSTGLFKQYAGQLRLNGQQFNTCLDSKKYNEVVKAESAQAQEFGIMAVPGIFIGDEYSEGANQYDTLKAMIDRQLEKGEAVKGDEGNKA